MDQSNRVADVTEFFTYQHPDEYYPDWVGYYRRALEGRKSVQSRYPHDLGVRYGDHPNQFANVYRSVAPTEDAPFILYFHGGRWREGHPDFYDHLALPWVEDGAIFASCGYRLEPECTIADAVDDCVSAIGWAHRTAQSFGASSNRLIVAGHSAGGHIAAMATLTDWAGTESPAHQAVRATICMSAPSDLRMRGVDDDPELERLSPALAISRAPEHVVVSYGDPEPNKKSSPDDELTRHGRTLTHALQQAGHHPVVVELHDSDHIATAAAFADRESPLHAAARAALSERATNDH